MGVLFEENDFIKLHSVCGILKRTKDFILEILIKNLGRNLYDVLISNKRQYDSKNRKKLKILENNFYNKTKINIRNIGNNMTEKDIKPTKLFD